MLRRSYPIFHEHLLPDGRYTYSIIPSFVFAVKHREALLDKSWDSRLRLDITGIIQNNGHKMLAINNMPDHLHMLIGLDPKQSISELMRLVKADSSEWINKEKLVKTKFQWQEGYGAFTHSRSQIDKVARYIHNQQQHHSKAGFIDEYRKMLTNFEVSFDERYIFTPPG